MDSLPIIEPANRAFQGMIRRLFKPFAAGKWFALGFTAWLATLLEGAGNLFSFNPMEWMDLQHADFDFQEIWAAHQVAIVGVLAALFVFAFIVGVVFLWLDCRGKFMFLRNTIDDTAKITEPWNEWREQAQSLFWWQLGFWGVTLAAMALLGFAGALVAGFTSTFGDWSAARVAGISLIGLLFLILMIAALIITTLLRDIIVPVMMKNRVNTSAAWIMAQPALRQHAVSVLLYLLFKLLVLMAAGTAIGILGLLTCCCFFILLAIPYINAVAMLPYTVFIRLYALEFMKGLGAEFDLLSPEMIPPGEAAFPDAADNI